MTNQAHAFEHLIARDSRDAVTDMFPQAPVDPDARLALQKLLGKTRQVKRARFNAQSRFEAKNMASIVALTMVSILSIAISMYSGTHQGTEGFADLKPTLDFMANSMSLLVLSFGFVVALGSYQDKALRMQRCAMDLGRLIDEIEVTQHERPLNRGQLMQWATTYNDIIQQCPYNHNDVDFDKAQFNTDTTWSARWRNTFFWYADVWGIHVFFALVLVAFWLVAG
ncbi:MAG: SLATT domain-containing protein [Hyphomicrobiaceae bacterium]